MKIRTLRTYDELVAFHRLVGEQYPDYWEHARLAHVYYGVFDVGDDSVAWGEGDVLFAGAAVNLGYVGSSAGGGGCFGSYRAPDCGAWKARPGDWWWASALPGGCSLRSGYQAVDLSDG